MEISKSLNIYELGPKDLVRSASHREMALKVFFKAIPDSRKNHKDSELSYYSIYQNIEPSENIDVLNKIIYKFESIGHYMYKTGIANVFRIIESTNTKEEDMVYKLISYDAPKKAFNHSKPEIDHIQYLSPDGYEIYKYSEIPYIHIYVISLDMYNDWWFHVQNMKDNERMVISAQRSNIAYMSNKTKIEEFDSYVQNITGYLECVIIHNKDETDLMSENLELLKFYPIGFLRKDEIVKVLYFDPNVFYTADDVEK